MPNFLEDFCGHADVEERLIESNYGPCINCEKGQMDLIERRQEKFVFCFPGEKSTTEIVKCQRCDHATDSSYYKSLKEQEEGQATAERERRSNDLLMYGSQQQQQQNETELQKRQRLAKQKRQERQAKRKEEQVLAKQAKLQQQQEQEEQKQEWNERLSRGSISVPPDLYLDKIASEFRNHCVIQDRKYRLQTYRNCFVGSETVDSLVESGMVVDREHAVTLGRRLAEERRLFAHVTKDHMFQDKPLFYRFSDDEAWKTDPVRPPSIKKAAGNVRASVQMKKAALSNSIKRRIICPITGKLVCPETGKVVDDSSERQRGGDDDTEKMEEESAVVDLVV